MINGGIEFPLAETAIATVTKLPLSGSNTSNLVKTFSCYNMIWSLNCVIPFSSVFQISPLSNFKRLRTICKFL